MYTGPCSLTVHWLYLLLTGGMAIPNYKGAWQGWHSPVPQKPEPGEEDEACTAKTGRREQEGRDGAQGQLDEQVAGTP